MERNSILEQNQVMETKRLLLRKITMEDAVAVFAWTSQAETVRYDNCNQHQSIDETQKLIAEEILPRNHNNWGIVEKHTGTLIGRATLFVDEKSKIAVLSWVLNKDYWGKGYAPEAAKRLVDLCFQELNVLGIQALHHPENINSGRVMKKIGMKHTGKVLQSFKEELLFFDYWCLTLEEWRKNG